MYNYTKLSFLNLALERFVKKGVIRSNTSNTPIFTRWSNRRHSSNVPMNPPSLSSFIQLNLNLCASREDREEKRRCRDTSVLLYGPDNGPFVRHCILATLIVSLKPDDLRGYETAPPSSFPYLTVPFLFWHPFCIESLVRGWSRVDEPEEEELKFEIEGVEKKWKVNQFYKGLLFIFSFLSFTMEFFSFSFFFIQKKKI